MKLLFIFTGGTIGSTAGDGYISTDKSKSYKLIKLYDEKYKIDFDYDVVEPYLELSENNTGIIIRRLTECVAENIGKGYDGIIVTHGTDTLQYSACALSYSLGADSIPICLVSSNFPVENPVANGLPNLHGAIKFIMNENPRGVWVPYQNESGTINIHRGTRILSGNAFSDKIYSVRDMVFGYYDADMVFHKNMNYKEKKDEIAPLSAGSLGEFCDSVLRTVPYPGMKYPKIGNDIRFIIHETYHSGTINSKQSDLSRFIDYISKNHIQLFLTGIYEGNSYESTKIYSESIIHPVKNISPVSVYMKVWMAYSSGISPESIINKSLCGDVVL